MSCCDHSILNTMSHYNEYDEHRELSVIIRGKEKECNNVNAIQLSMEQDTGTHEMTNDQEVDDEIVIKNLKLIQSAENSRFDPSLDNGEGDTVVTVDNKEGNGDDEYDTLDELFDIAKLLSDSLDKQQLIPVKKVQIPLDISERQQSREYSNMECKDDDGNNENQLLMNTTGDNLISSRNVEIKQVVIGYPDRMSIVMEESDVDNDEDFTSEASVRQNINNTKDDNNNDALVYELSPNQQNIFYDDSVPTNMTKLVENPNEPMRIQSQSPTTSDVTTIDENDIAGEIEIHQQPLENWVEDSYATVVRHVPTSTSTNISTPRTITAITHTVETEVSDFIQDDLDIYNPHEEYNRRLANSKLINGDDYDYDEDDNDEDDDDDDEDVGIAEDAEDDDDEDVDRLLYEMNIRTASDRGFQKQQQLLIQLQEQKRRQHEEEQEYLQSDNLVKSHLSQNGLEERTKWRTCPTLILPSRESMEQPRCHACGEVVYPLEALHTIGRVYHKTCFKCHHCQRVLSLGKYSVWEGNPYCEPHYLVLFKAFGHYDSNVPKTSNTTSDSSSHVRRGDSLVTAEERPSSNVTQVLVAKFQGLEAANNMTSSTQNQLSRIVLNSNSHSVPVGANGDVFPSSGSARQLVERWNKMPHENKLGGRASPELNGKFHGANSHKLPIVEPKPIMRKLIEQPRPLVNELKQNFNHKPEDEAYCSSESTESGKASAYHKRDGKQNEFPAPGITRHLVAKFSSLSAAS
ncbi:unnamed protein product [Heterobilharzia americana]|nr:unnamed protein product [Heterobilharzia americana]